MNTLDQIREVQQELKDKLADRACGIRRWFQRRRLPLAGLSPLAVLGEAWHPESAGPGRLMALAEDVRQGMVAT